LKKYIYISILFFSIGLKSYAQNKPVWDFTNTTTKFIKLYPNPASTNINFDFQKNFDANSTFLIYNFMGKRVFEYKNSSLHNNLNLSSFYRGVYIYQLRDKYNAIIESGKFQVIK